MPAGTLCLAVKTIDTGAGQPVVAERCHLLIRILGRPRIRPLNWNRPRLSELSERLRKNCVASLYPAMTLLFSEPLPTGNQISVASDRSLNLALVPSGVKTTVHKSSVCPSSTALSFPVFASHNFTVFAPPLTDVRVLQFPDIATDQTPNVWASIVAALGSAMARSKSPVTWKR